MDTADEIQILLTELRTIYNNVKEKQDYWEKLQMIDLAFAEYEKLTKLSVEEEGKLQELRRRKQSLEEERRKLQRVPDQDNFVIPQLARPARHMPPRHAAPVKKSESQRDTGSELDQAAERDQLIKFVNRWRYSWRLDSTVLGKINRIASDSDRPLGEALILLDWSVFADRTRTQESPELHLSRLKKWRSSLVDYQRWLLGDIDRRQTEAESQGQLKIWERWRGRTEGEQARELWMALIADSRRSKQETIRELEKEIDQLSSEIGRSLEQLRKRDGAS